MTDAAVRDFAEAITPEQSQGDGTYLRRGQVVSVSGGYQGTATVTIGGLTIPGVLYYRHLTLYAGDNVDVLFDGPTPRIVGVLNAASEESIKQLAHGIANVNTGGACKGKWGDGSGAGVTSVPAGATDVDVSLGLANVPVRPNRVLRATLRLADADVVTNAYRTMTMYTNWNGGGFYPFRRSVTYANGAGGTSYYAPALDVFVFATPTNAATLSIKTYGNTNTGTAYFYRYATYTGQDSSFITLEDIGSAADFIAQGGTFG